MPLLKNKGLVDEGLVGEEGVENGPFNSPELLE
jgi:hypothetical protein